MEDEQSILDATEYILMALNNIKNYKEFIEYKEEITKAIYDIRSSITNIMNMKKNNPNIYNNQQDQSILNNSANPSSISSILGLKFNYDAYLNDFQLKNLVQNDTTFNKTFNQEIQNNNLNLKFINNENPNNNDNLMNNLNNNQFTFQEQNNNFELSHNDENNEDNIVYNKSIRNQFKINRNQANNDSLEKNNNNINNCNNNINNDIQKENENIEQIRNREQMIINNNKQKTYYKKEKLSLIADIIMKINSEDYYYDILTKLFGDDLTDKLMSSEVSDDLLDAVQNSIKEIEELKKKDDLKSQNQVQNNKFHQANADEIEDQPKRFPIEQISNPNIKQNINRNNSNKKLNNEKNNYQEFNFQKNLRKAESEDNYGKNNKKNGNKNSSSKKEKPFISATSAYGNYFDPPLQKGGFSKLDEYKKNMNA